MSAYITVLDIWYKLHFVFIFHGYYYLQNATKVAAQSPEPVMGMNASLPVPSLQAKHQHDDSPDPCWWLKRYEIVLLKCQGLRFYDYYY